MRFCEDIKNVGVAPSHLMRFPEIRTIKHDKAEIRQMFLDFKSRTRKRQGITSWANANQDNYTIPKHTMIDWLKRL